MSDYVDELPKKRKTLTLSAPIAPDIVAEKPKGKQHKSLRRRQRAYFVYAEGQDIPRKLYQDRDSAFNAARHLSRMYPELRVHVLQSWRALVAGVPLTVGDPDFTPVGPQA